MAEETKEMTALTQEQLQAVLHGGNINDIAPQKQEEEKPEETPEAEVQTGIETPEAGKTEEPSGGTETPQETPQTFDIEFFNKQFSTEFTDEDSIKEALKAIQENEDLKKQVGTIESLKEELELLREEADPMKYFGSEDDYRVAQFKQSFPGKDPAMVARLFSTDLKQVNDFDVLTWMTMLDNPDLVNGEKGARELVADQYGIDDPSDPDSMDSLALNKLRVNASKERARVKEMKDGIQLPEKKDYSSLMEQRKAEQAEKLEKLTSDWSQIASKVASNYPDIVLNDKDKDGNVSELFRYQVGKDMNENIVKPVVEGFIKAGIPVEQQSAEALTIALQKEFIFQNRDKIVKQAVKDALARQEENTLEEEHNPGTPNDKERPKGGGNDVTQKILSNLRTGMGAKRAY